MDSERALAATAAIRQMVETLPIGFQPKPTTGQDAQRELNIIRENSPLSCKRKLTYASTWLNILFIPEKREKYSANTNTPVRLEQIQASVLSLLARIEAELMAQGRGTA